jgi:hypothetical protein
VGQDRLGKLRGTHSAAAHESQEYIPKACSRTSRISSAIVAKRILDVNQPPIPAGATWFYRAATYGVGGDQVDDPQTKTGQAWQMTVKKHQPGGKISGPLIMDQKPGLYRAVFRMKVADRSSPPRQVLLRITCDGLPSRRR